MSLLNADSNSKTDAESESIASTNNLTLRRQHSWGRVWWVLTVGLVTAGLCLPFFRSVYWLGDEGVLLNGAVQLLKGNRLYVDFFEMLPPGGFVLTAAWLKFAGVSMSSARALAILCIVAIACLTYLTCWQVSKDKPLSVFLTIAWVVMSQGYQTQVSHHWFTTLFSMVSALAAIA